MEVGLETLPKNRNKGEKFLQNFISTRDGPEKVQEQGEDERTQELRLPYIYRVPFANAG